MLGLMCWVKYCKCLTGLTGFSSHWSALFFKNTKHFDHGPAQDARGLDYAGAIIQTRRYGEKQSQNQAQKDLKTIMAFDLLRAPVSPW